MNLFVIEKLLQSSVSHGSLRNHSDLMLKKHLLLLWMLKTVVLLNISVENREVLKMTAYGYYYFA